MLLRLQCVPVKNFRLIKRRDLRKAAVLSTHFGKTTADFKTNAGKDYKKADYDAMFTAENGKDETTLATATAPPGSP